jgi:hypothetical protein
MFLMRRNLILFQPGPFLWPGAIGNRLAKMPARAAKNRKFKCYCFVSGAKLTLRWCEVNFGDSKKLGMQGAA